ncbi:14623_t:CDS:2, partial [Acaulospora colombiana]
MTEVVRTVYALRCQRLLVEGGACETSVAIPVDTFCGGLLNDICIDIPPNGVDVCGRETNELLEDSYDIIEAWLPLLRKNPRFGATFLVTVPPYVVSLMLPLFMTSKEPDFTICVDAEVLFFLLLLP